MDDLLHREAEHFLKRIAANLAHNWESPIPKCVDMLGQTGLCYHKGNQLVSKGFTSKVEEWMMELAPLYSIVHRHMYISW